MVVRKVTKHNAYYVKDALGNLVVAVISGKIIKLAQRKISSLTRHSSRGRGI